MREREWDTAIREPLAWAGAGAPVLVLVEGEAGTGKTRFVRWLLGLPELGQTPRLTVTFTASGASIVQGSARPTGTASPLPTASAAASLGELTASIGARAPMWLVADNVHRADKNDVCALRTVLAHPPAGLRAVLTYRPEELAHPGLVLGAPVGYPAGLTLLRIRLGPLGEAQVRRMAVEALGEDRCSAPFITRLYERSGGVAQVVADLVAQLQTAGPPADGRAKADGRDRLSARDVDEAAVPVRLAELVVGRMAALDEEQRRVVWAAAALDETASEGELTSVAALPAASGRAALTAALSEAVLHEVGPGRYGFRVPMEAAAVYQLLPGPVRRELHGRAAEVLAARHPVPWSRLARQQLASGRIADWLESAENAARKAIEAGEHRLAISLLKGALAHPEVPQSPRARLALLLARSAVVVLRSDQTVELLRRLVDDHTLPAAARGEIRLDLGLLIGNRLGRGGEAGLELARAVDELGHRPALAAQAMSALALPYWPSAPLADNLAWLARAEAAAAESGDAAAQVAVAANRVTVLLSVGDPDGWRRLRQLPRDSDDLRILLHSARGLVNAAHAAVWLGEYTRARELLAEGVQLNARGGAPHWEQGIRGTSLLLDMVTGRWAGLAARARGLEWEAGEMPFIAGDARLVLGLLAVAKGEWGRVGTLLSGAGLSGDDGAVPLAAAASGGRIRLALARQDPAGAAGEAAEAWARLRAKGVWVWAAELAPWAVEATVRAGELGTARKMVDEFATSMESRQAPAATAALSWCRALLAEADGELHEAVLCFHQARTRYQALPRPYEAALTAEAGGRCALAGSRKTTVGIAQLDAAAKELDAIGAAWDLARVRAELRTHQPAERRRPGRPSYGKRLSPREQEVAELAGAGLSNREIAATLHLSPRTVEQHVARARRKLGAVTRRDLAPADRNSEPRG